jgi:hypothetical protein
MDNAHSDTPPELVFPPQVPFSWTLRGARAARLSAGKPRRSISYRIAGVADMNELNALVVFCEQHAATLELDR